MEFEFPNARRALHVMANRLDLHGDIVNPRGQLTREFTDVTIFMENPRIFLPDHMGREPNHGILAAEALQLMAGLSDVDLLTRVTSAFRRFTNGSELAGAYGPRLAAQFPRVVERLRNDRHSRQAVAVIWDPMRDLMRDGIRDIPCTVYMSFRIRDGALTMKTHMRSNDIWLGWTYDYPVFALLQLTMAQLLGVKVDKYVHHVDSLHLYARDVRKLEKLLHDDHIPENDTVFTGLEAIHDQSTWADVQKRATDIMYGTAEDMGFTERWLSTALAGYR